MARQRARIQLTGGERKDLRELLKSGVMPARTVVRALALLRLDGGLSVAQTAGLLELTGEGVRKIVLRYRAGGLEAAVYEGSRPGKKPALDAAQKQKVIDWPVVRLRLGTPAGRSDCWPLKSRREN